MDSTRGSAATTSETALDAATHDFDLPCSYTAKTHADIAHSKRHLTSMYVRTSCYANVGDYNVVVCGSI